MRVLKDVVEKYILIGKKQRVYYDIVKGKKRRLPLLVMLHGLGGDLTGWDLVRKKLNTYGYSTLAIDLRGFGLSYRSGEENYYELNNFSNDLKIILLKEKPKKFVLVGHCFGGIVSMKFAINERNFPGFFGLILVNSSDESPFFTRFVSEYKPIYKVFSKISTTIPNVGFGDRRENMIKYVGSHDWDIRRLFSDVAYTCLRTYLLVCKKIIDDDIGKYLKTITLPTLLIIGTNDLVYLRRYLDNMNEKIQTSEVKYIEGGNHIMILNHPNEVARDIHSYLLKKKISTH